MNFKKWFYEILYGLFSFPYDIGPWKELVELAESGGLEPVKD